MYPSFCSMLIFLVHYLITVDRLQYFLMQQQLLLHSDIREDEMPLAIIIIEQSRDGITFTIAMASCIKTVVIGGVLLTAFAKRT